MKRIKEMWRTMRQNWKKRNAESMRKNAERTSERVLQVREYENSIFICMDDVPLLTAEQLSDDIISTLWKMRELYVGYSLEKKMQGNGKQD